MPIRYLRCAAILTVMAAIAFLGGGCSYKNTIETAGAVSGSEGPKTIYDGGTVSSTRGVVTDGLVIPDGDGGVILVQGNPFPQPSKGLVEARELRLKVRELTEQLIADMTDCSLQGLVALPTAFVHLDNFNDTSSFGRLMAEQLYYEFNQRGYPIREYRMPGSIRVNKKGEFALTRAIKDFYAKSMPAVVVVGTYYNDPQAIFVNARLVRPADGYVLRTASLVLNANPLARRMLDDTKLTAGTMTIRDFHRTTNPPPPAPVNTSPFDVGQDIH